jgi:hypothetical protein
MAEDPTTETVDEEVEETANLTVFPDEPPSSGEWVDTDEVLASVTAQEMADGHMDGGTIDEAGSDDE